MTLFTRRTLTTGALAATGALAGAPLLEWAKAWAQAAPWKPEKGAQLGLLRDATWPVSVSGVRPAARMTGTLSREAFIRPHMALAVPTVTWTITAAGLPLTRDVKLLDIFT